VGTVTKIIPQQVFAAWAETQESGKEPPESEIKDLKKIIPLDFFAHTKLQIGDYVYLQKDPKRPPSTQGEDILVCLCDQPWHLSMIITFFLFFFFFFFLVTTNSRLSLKHGPLLMCNGRMEKLSSTSLRPNLFLEPILMTMNSGLVTLL